MTDCYNCGHPFSDHVTHVTDDESHPIQTFCYYPVHRNYDCPCARFEQKKS